MSATNPAAAAATTATIHTDQLPENQNQESSALTNHPDIVTVEEGDQHRSVAALDVNEMATMQVLTEDEARKKPCTVGPRSTRLVVVF